MTKYKVIAYMDTIRMHDKRLCNNTYRNIHCKRNSNGRERGGRAIRFANVDEKR
jgi:hypothetical protein